MGLQKMDASGEVGVMDDFFAVKELNTGYGKHIVLENVSFSLAEGTMTGLLGANGSGKSTLLKAVCGQLPYQGECLLRGEALKGMHVRRLAREVSYIPQRSGIHLSLPALDVVLMGFNPVLKLLQNPDAGQKASARDALGAVGLGGMEERNYLTLSEGQKQLCILARTIVENTSLLLLDEPDSALDIRNRYSVLRILRRLLEGQEKAALLCLHDPVLALDFCEQLILLKEGHCIASLHPARDSLGRMQEALAEIYGPLTLARCSDRHGRMRLVLLSE